MLRMTFLVDLAGILPVRSAARVRWDLDLRTSELTVRLIGK